MADLDKTKESFLETCITASAFRFGTFKLNSGRISPYFYNAGLFHRADLLSALTTAYAKTIIAYSDAHGLSFDVIFGPAYKGIPLATAVVSKLADLDPKRYSQCSYSFNRKEPKDHGEGGQLVGSPVKGKKVLIIDDVITAGKAIREAIDLIRKEGGVLVGIIVGFDRMEKSPESLEDPNSAGRSAIGEVEHQYKLPILSILSLEDVIQYLKRSGSEGDLRKLEEYRQKYGST